MNFVNPIAITMWDFSWLERRWSGAGFEDWDLVLDELVDRGYNAVRIDAFPHLTGDDPDKERTLVPIWTIHNYGCPYLLNVNMKSALIEFIQKCKIRNVKVALSSWYREDTDDLRMKITSPEKMAEIWIKTIELIDKAGLLSSILFVDICNEWPLSIWAPYFYAAQNTENQDAVAFMSKNDWSPDISMSYMKKVIEIVRKEYPDIPLTFSTCNTDLSLFVDHDLSFMDFIEHHIWMTMANDFEFMVEINASKHPYFEGKEAHYEDEYRRMSDNISKVYDSRPEYWNDCLVRDIKTLAANVESKKMSLVTTESWCIIMYKDFPGLTWEWIKAVNSIGVQTALNTGRWWAVTTSNYTTPQQIGMWREVEWHREQTAKIKSAKVAKDILNERIIKAMTF